MHWGIGKNGKIKIKCAKLKETYRRELKALIEDSVQISEPLQKEQKKSHSHLLKSDAATE